MAKKRNLGAMSLEELRAIEVEVQTLIQKRANQEIADLEARVKELKTLTAGTRSSAAQKDYPPAASAKAIKAKAKPAKRSYNRREPVKSAATPTKTEAPKKVAAEAHRTAKLTPAKPARKRKPSALKGKKAPVKFLDPVSGKSWSGRGMTPVWMREYEAAGKPRGAFAV